MLALVPPLVPVTSRPKPAPEPELVEEATRVMERHGAVIETASQMAAQLDPRAKVIRAEQTDHDKWLVTVEVAGAPVEGFASTMIDELSSAASPRASE